MRASDDDWHFVGHDGEPPFENGWQNVSGAKADHGFQNVSGAEHALIRYNGLLLALLATMAILYALAAITVGFLGERVLAVAFVALFAADIFAYWVVKEQRR